MWDTRLDETQDGIKIAGRNINNLRYADDTSLMAESDEELKSFLMKVKQESESAVQFSCSVVSDSLRPYGLQHTTLHCPSPTPKLAQTPVHWVSNTILPSHPLSSPSPPAFNLSQHQGLFKWKYFSLHQVAKVLEFQLQHQSFQWIFRTDFLQDGLVGSPCSPRDSQESSPTLQFKSINSSALSFLYKPTLTSIHDHCKNHSLD